jgi:hypothetical protein
MKKSSFTNLMLLITFFIIIGGSELSAHKKTKKEQKEYLAQKARLEKVQAELGFFTSTEFMITGYACKNNVFNFESFI